MKRITLIGDSLPEKTAWPMGRLGTDLEPLDPRHTVFAPLVTLPLLAAVSHLSGDRQFDFIAQVTRDILEEGDGNRRPRRFNTFSGDIREINWPATKVKVTDEVAALLGGGPQSLQPETDVCLCFGYWSISGIIVYLLTADGIWTEDQLKQSSEQFLTGVLREISRTPGLKNDFPPTLPAATTAQTGVYFKVCTHPNRAAVLDVLRRQVKEFMLDEMPSGADKSDVAVQRVCDLIRSMVPLLHIEGTRAEQPVGLRQACFVNCLTPEELRTRGPMGGLYWKHVGAAIARMLVE